ncbi:MAG: chemotaxis protein CheW [Dictyoglomus sp.]|nr:chemotaxis protein CheW [Dictyoglomus sp.]MDW8189198.1 chemotaxis protein CheW [Dictyoglomus sp.]
MFNKLDEDNSYVIFQLGNTYYGIRSKYIQQIEMIENITHVPNVPNYIEGVVFSRGKVIPAINLRVRLGMEKIHFNIKTRMIVVKVKNREVGLIVDSAREYTTISKDKIQESFEDIFEVSERFLEGVANLGDRLILILNLEEILKEGGKESEEEKK